MADENEKKLRGKAPLTMWRGNGAPGGALYRGGVVDPKVIEPADRDRLVREGFLEWVVRDGETWRLAEDTATGSAGDPVTVGDAAVVDPNADPGMLNVAPLKPPTDESGADVEVERKRAEAKAKLPVDGSAPDGRASEAVWVEYAVTQGLDRSEAEKAGKDELRKLLAAESK